MTVRALRFDERSVEHDEVRSRTRWTMTVSAVVHAALMLMLIFMKPTAETASLITEITMLGPGDLEPAAAAAGPAAAARASEPASGARTSASTDEHFLRRASDAVVAPDPQSGLVSADRMSARLAAMRETSSLPAAGGVVGVPSALWSTPNGVPNATGSGGQAITLSRGGGGGLGPPLALGRGTGTGLSPALAGAGTGPKLTESAPAPAGDAHVRRTLAGASLAGPIADREVLHIVTPVYPEWAKRDGVEGAVTLYFVVRPDGSVKENVLIQKTAGFADLDDNARAALGAWRFEPLRAGRTGEQWGTITFHYRLRDA